MDGSIFFVSAARGEASKIFFCRHFVLSVKTLAVAGLLVGRVVFVQPNLSVLDAQKLEHDSAIHFRHRSILQSNLKASTMRYQYNWLPNT